MFWVTVALAGLSAVGAFFIWQTYGYVREGPYFGASIAGVGPRLRSLLPAGTVARTVQPEPRIWLTVEPARSAELIVGDGGLAIKCRYKLKNPGPAPVERATVNTVILSFATVDLLINRAEALRKLLVAKAESGSAYQISCPVGETAELRTGSTSVPLKSLDQKKRLGIVFCTCYWCPSSREWKYDIRLYDVKGARFEDGTHPIELVEFSAYRRSS